jgi:flagellar L-ring protein precursor FlgH
MKQLLIPILTVLAVCAPQGAFAQERRGSIYNPNNGPFGLVANKTAARPGDLVTVLIQESQDLKNEEKSDLKTQKGLDTQLTSFNIAPDAFSTLPDVKSSTNNTFAGTANYEKKGNFTARLTAMVVDALPNGNLVISGRREIRIDNETKVIEFSGVVRRYDITAGNTIESELVANARVSYSGSGPLTRSTNRHGIGGFLFDAFIWIWPF